MIKIEKWVLTTLIVNRFNNTVKNVEYGGMRPVSDTDVADSGAMCHCQDYTEEI